MLIHIEKLIDLYGQAVHEMTRYSSARIRSEDPDFRSEMAKITDRRTRQAARLHDCLVAKFAQVRCAYCGAVTGDEPAETLDHAITCPERPELKLNAVIEDLAKQLDRATLALRQALRPESGDDLLAAMDTLRELTEGEPC